jgi:hypothetical protein
MLERLAGEPTPTVYRATGVTLVPAVRRQANSGIQASVVAFSLSGSRSPAAASSMMQPHRDLRGGDREDSAEGRVDDPGHFNKAI